MLMQVIEEKFELANKWIHLQNRKISVLQGLKEKGITKIIIYGTSEFALRLLEQCDNEDNAIEVVGIGDKKVSFSGATYNGIPLLSMDDISCLDMSNTCVIITAMGFCKEIEKELQEKGICPVLSLRELIYDAYYWADRMKEISAKANST